MKNIELTRFELEPETEQQLRKYTDVLLAENQKYNLIGKLDLETLWTEHIFDSLAAAPFLEKNIVDIGSGGGLPAIPLAVLRPELQFTLVDSNNKKISFLNRLSADMNLNNVVTAHERVESFSKNNKHKFLTGTAKAVAKINILLEYFSPLIQHEGKCFLYKGPDYLQEIDQAKKAAEITGFQLEKVFQYVVRDKQRYLLQYNKIAPAKIALPRAIGQADLKPIV